jgi:hypothetical protein
LQVKSELNAALWQRSEEMGRLQGNLTAQEQTHAKTTARLEEVRSALRKASDKLGMTAEDLAVSAVPYALHNALHCDDDDGCVCR